MCHGKWFHSREMYRSLVQKSVICFCLSSCNKTNYSWRWILTTQSHMHSYSVTMTMTCSARDATCKWGTSCHPVSVHPSITLESYQNGQMYNEAFFLDWQPHHCSFLSPSSVANFCRGNKCRFRKILNFRPIFCYLGSGITHSPVTVECKQKVMGTSSIHVSSDNSKWPWKTGCERPSFFQWSPHVVCMFVLFDRRQSNLVCYPCRT